MGPFDGYVVVSSLHCQNVHALQGLTLEFAGGDENIVVCQAATTRGSVVFVEENKLVAFD